jgi:DNA-binding NarL/FixJ family response regulator
MVAHAGYSDALGMSLRLALTDSQPLYREALAAWLRRQQQVVLLAELADPPLLHGWLDVASPRPEVVVIGLAGADELQLVQTLKQRWPGIALVALSHVDEPALAAAWQSAGGHSLWLRDTAPDRLLLGLLEAQSQPRTDAATRLPRLA